MIGTLWICKSTKKPLILKIISDSYVVWITGNKKGERDYYEIHTLERNYQPLPKELENESEEVIRFYLEL